MDPELQRIGSGPASAGSAAYAAPVVAIDGPSGAGKSTVSRSIALDLGLRYLDTGATYRALTWWLLQRGVNPRDLETIAEIMSRPQDLPQLEAGTDPHGPTIRVDGTDVEPAIRTPEVTAAVSPVSAVPAVRDWLVALQRSIIGTGGIVVEGRDIGTVVAPSADVKIFLTADATARAQRRLREMQASRLSASRASEDSDEAAAPESSDFSADGMLAAINRRDHLDSTRQTAPLSKAADAHEVDATAHELAQVVAIVGDIVRREIAARRSRGGMPAADVEADSWRDPVVEPGRRRAAHLPADVAAGHLGVGRAMDTPVLPPSGGRGTTVHP